MDNKEEKKKISNRQTLREIKKIYEYSKTSRKYMIIFFITSLLLCAVSVIIPILSAQEIVSLTNSAFDELITIAIAIFAIEMTRNLCTAIGNLAANRFYFDVTEKLRYELSKETLKIKIDEINKNTSGVFLERINNDASEVGDIFGMIIEAGTDLITKFGIFIAVFFINKLVFFLFLLFILILGKIEKKAANEVQVKDKIRKKSKEKISGFISEIVRGSKDIKILNAENSFLDKTMEMNREVKNIQYDYIKTRSGWRCLNGSVRDTLTLLESFALIGTLYIGQISLSSVLIIYNYSWEITNIGDGIGYLLDYWKRYQLASDRIFGVIDGDEFEKEKFGDKPLKDFKGKIKFDNVSFSYDENVPVIKDMSFDIRANHTVAFVGKSGAGKTTIFNLMGLLYDNYDGTIYFDDMDIKTLDKSSLRGNLSIISQNPYIYNLSIKENLTIIKRDATDEDVDRVLKLACLDEFVNSLPNGVDTLVGEGGVSLSGGQRQRLAIARALLQETKLILFDEATSALDNETQSKIQEAIHNMKGDYTIIIIAHRLSTVKDSDCIFVVDDGAITDYGTESELLEKSQTFRNLYNSELEK